MKKQTINLVGVGILLMSVLTNNLGANPLPSCSDEWCHYTEPNIAYDADFDLNDLFESETNTELQNWMSDNCPNWPDINDPVFRVLNLPDRLHWDYDNAVNKLWLKKNPQETGVTYDGKQEKIREEQYLAAQKEKYGRNIPYCLTEKAQDRVQQARWKTEKYLHDAPNVPMVRDRVVLLAKIEEANAKTAKELGLENLYKAPPKWQIDKATLDAWWAETHPNGRFLDKQAIKQRYKDYFTKQAWKEANPNSPEPSIEKIRTWGEEKKIQDEQALQKRLKEYENKVKNWWDVNYPDWPEDAIGNMGLDYEMTSAYGRYKDDVDELWLKHHPQERRSPLNCINCPDKFSVPFEEREHYYLDKQKENYGRNIPHCLTKEEQTRRHEYRKEMEEYVNDPETGNREYFEEQLQSVLAQERASEKVAAKLNLKNNLELTPSVAQNKDSSCMYLLLVGLVVISIVGLAVIILMRRKKKNLPK